MTCTIAIIDGNVVVMGCDSAATDEDNVLTLRKGCCKIWKVENFMVGFCGNYSELMWIKYAFDWPSKKKSETLEHWLISKVYKNIQKAFENRKDVSWSLMFGFSRPGRIMVLRQCGDLEERVDDFNAIGSASQLAIGSLKTMEENKELYSWEKIENALKISEKYDCSVRGPMHYDVIMNEN